MKRAIKVFAMIAMVLLATSIAAFAATDTVDAASKKMIPGTNAKADSRVVNSFVDLGFTVKYDKNLGHAGVFSVAKHAVIMKSNNTTHVLHEMGHFVSRLQNAADEKKAFVKIYKAEKNNYDGAQKEYITKNGKEYFAQSFAEYTQNPARLKNNRPQTYEYIKAQVDTISQQHVDNMYAAYGWAW